MSSWFDHHLETTPTHLSYILISTFLLFYALLSSPIRNSFHLSEPPLATLLGIAFGPWGAAFLHPTRWGIEDNVTQEAARVIVGLQVFSVGVELPKKYLSRRDHAISVAMLLGPVMTFSWLVTAGFVYAILRTRFSTALIIGACLAPTDPVLAASVLAESRFAHRVPVRIRHMLSAESGCNDGVSFPFVYIGILLLIKPTLGEAAKEWVLGTILWQCTLGTLIGLVIGKCFNVFLRLSSKRQSVSAPAFLVFYLLLAIFSIGVGATLGVDDFLVAFGAGYGFAYDGWFSRKTRATHLPQILDLLLNSSMFIYFGTIIPWHLIESSSRSESATALSNSLSPLPSTLSSSWNIDLRSSFPKPSPLFSENAWNTLSNITPPRLLLLLLLILLFRRIPAILFFKPFIPTLRTWPEALFAGHFGPMGLGALFLAIEARAMLENGTSLPDRHPDPERTKFYRDCDEIWAVVTFVILGSVMVHGFSVAAISVGVSLRRRWRARRERERRSLLDGTGTGTVAARVVGQEEDGLEGMIHESEDSVTEASTEEEDFGTVDPYRP